MSKNAGNKESGLEKLKRKFKRQYNYAAKVVREEGLPNISVTFRWDVSEGGSSKLDLPKESGAARFWNVMRPFLNPSSDTYFRSFWNQLRRESEIRPEHKKAIDDSINSIDTGTPWLQNHEGKNLHPEKIYRLISNSGYFDERDEEKQAIKGEENTPAFPQLLWFVFNDFNIFAYRLVSSIIEVIHDTDSGQAPAAEIRGKCVYCLGENGPFTTEEHVYPESLAGDQVLLDKGLVCDSCQNKLSVLDQVLVDFEPVAFLRVMHTPHTKKGKFPRAVFQQGTITKKHPRVIEILCEDGKPAISTLGNHKFRVQITGKKKFDPVQLGRALCKVGLGMVAYLGGHEEACSDRYDSVRKFIKGETDFQNHLIISSRSDDLHHEIKTNIWNKNGTIVLVDIWGIRFLFNIEEEPKINVPPELKNLELLSFSLTE